MTPVGDDAGARRAAATPDSSSEQLRAWLQVLDALLTAIEQAAWEAREVGVQARDAFRGTQAGIARWGALARSWIDGFAAERERLLRLAETGWVLSRIAAAYRLHATRAAFVSHQAAARSLAQVHQQSARRFHALSVRQGGAFLKVGQMLSARPDLLPAPWIEELSKLQDAAPAIPWSEVERVLGEELGERAATAFTSLEERPIASASIGQVHRAVLSDGREVAVKVQRPGLERLIELDLDLLERFTRALGDSLPPIDLDTIIEEVRAMIWAELDYEREAATTERVAAGFRDHPSVRVPEVIRPLCARRLLVTRFEAGRKITDELDRLAASEELFARERLSAALARVLEAYSAQVLELGLFQADPHPGNLLLREDGVLVLLDFGCAKELDASGRQALASLALALVTRDVEAMTDGMQTLGFRTESGTREGLRAYATLVLAEADRIRHAGGRWPDQAEALAQVLRFARHIEGDPLTKLPAEMVMLGRVFGTLSGLFLHYGPDLEAVSAVLPLVLARLSQAARAS